MKVTDYKLVRVIWDDAASHDTWMKLNEVINDHSMACASVGWLVADMPDRLVIVASIDLDNADDMVSGHVTIPKAQVKEVTELTVRKTRKKKESVGTDVPTQ